MHCNQSNGIHNPEIDYICVAGDLLRRMMSELQSGVASSLRLALAMATAGHDLRQRLDSLLGTIELLTAADNPARAADLSRGAKAMIYGLADELEQLALQADLDAIQSFPLEFPFEVEPVLERVHLDECSDAKAKCLAFKITRTVAIVESDPYLLAVIVNNVVASAGRYTHSGELRVDCTIQDEYLVLEVRDADGIAPSKCLTRNYAVGSD